MPCEQFYSLDETHQGKLKLKSITVYQGMGGRIGGVRTELNNGNPAFLTPSFDLDSYHSHYEMELNGYAVDVISFQSEEENKYYFVPYGWKITFSNEEQQELDVVQNLQQDWRLKEYEHQYVKLEPNQTLIGIYGAKDWKDDFTRFGFIVKEKNE